jgi:hypothetical protein
LGKNILQLLTPEFGQIILLLAFVIPAILFLITQQKTLRAVQPGNRLMDPGMVWLQCIPLFGLIWQFVVVTRISDSISKEFASYDDNSVLGLSSPEIVDELGKRPTLGIGIAYCVIITIGVLANFFLKSPSSIELIAIWNLSGMVCWIIYWIKLVQYKRKLSRKYL